MKGIVEVLAEVAAILSAIAAIYAARGSNKNAKRIEGVSETVNDAKKTAEDVRSIVKGGDSPNESR